MTQINKRSSFSLVRTNPRLTTNIKIVNSNNRVFLDSIDADPILTKSMYKKFDVTGGNFSYDLYNFYNQGGKLPLNLAYKTFEKFSYESVKSSLSEQYDFEYCYGAYVKNSALYDEEFAIFAPLWVEKENIPEYFIILKLDGPVTKNSKDVIDLTSLDNEIINPDNFFNNYIKDTKLIKAISLKEGTPIGNYIRSHANDSSFPEGSIYATIKKDELSYINGISYHSGGFCQIPHNFYDEIVLHDKTILEKDNTITNKFMDLGVVHPNILNLEFLFDDVDDYKINRYMGFYVSEAQLTQFKVTDEFKNSTQNNSIKVKEFSENAENISLDYFYNRIPYVKDSFDNIYLINQTKEFQKVNKYIDYPNPGTYTIPTEIIIKNDFIKSNLFYNFEPVRTIDVLKTEKRGRSSFVFRVEHEVTEDTQIRIGQTELSLDHNDTSFDYFGIRGSSLLPPGTAKSIMFSVNGNSSDIAKAIACAINNIEILAGEQIFAAVAQSDLVIVYIKIETSFWDSLKWSIFSTAEIFPFTILNQDVLIQDVNDYILTYNSIKETLPQIDSTFFLRGKIVKSTFNGGSDRSNNRLIIDSSKSAEFWSNVDDIFVKNGSSFSKIFDVSCYLDEPLYDGDGLIYKFNNIEKWSVLLLSDDSNVTFNNKVILYKEKYPTMGYFSIYPIKDFDFDIYNTEYSKCEDSKIAKIWNYYLNKLEDYDINDYSLNDDKYDSFYKLNTLLGIFSNIFLSTKGFIKLNEVNLNEEYDKQLLDAKNNLELTVIKQSNLNEYDRLKEKHLTTFATFSKVVPFVNKWVCDDLSTDVRHNNYRLSTDQAFGHLNFSPSFDYFDRDPRYFTHEWYLLQQYPPYFTEEDKINSYSYFDSNINENLLKSNDNDYFNEYFTRRFVGQSPIKTDYKYSIFSGGNNQKFAECIFRGVKVRVKRRINNTKINYNLKDIKLIPDQTFNGFKFASILAINNPNEVGTSIKFIKNKKYKNITCLIKSDLSDVIQTDFIDRTLLYTLNHRVFLDGKINYANKVIAGQIYNAINSNDGIIVSAKNLNNRNFPNFKNDIILNENNTYNNIIFSDNNISITFNGIKTVLDNGTFICTNIIANYQGTDYTINSFSIENSISNEDSYLDIPGLPNSISMKFFMQCIKNNNITYEKGGYNGYYSVMKDITFANIANLINSGDPKIQYIEIDENGDEVIGNFIIELVKYDTELSSTYLKTVPILPNRDIDELNSFNIFGYDLTFKERTEIKPIYRNQFYFNPKVYDVINLCDDSNLPELKFKNTKFYTDKQFIIKNLFFNKVNTQNNSNIVKLTNVNQYPLIEQCTVSKKDFNIFKSNWDTNYYNEFLTESNSNNIIGTSEQFEQRSFMGSKLMLLPNNIQISHIYDTPIDSLKEDSINLSNLNSGIIYENSDNILKINILSDIILQNFLLNNNFFTSQFNQFINEKFSFGRIDLEDDMRRYISLNIKQRYIIKDIILWKKSLVYKDKEESLFKLDLTESQKVENSFIKITNFINEKKNAFNNTITYNKKLDETEQFSLTINLKKI